MAAATKALLVCLILASLSLGEAVFPKRNRFDANPNDTALVTATVEAVKPRLPHNLIVDHYNIKIQPYFANLTFDGSTDVYFQMTETTNQVSFDAYRLDIYSVMLYADGIRQQLVSANFDNNTDRINIIPVRFLQAGSNISVSFQFTGKINPYYEGGLFISTYQNPDETTGSIYATHFETGVGARAVYPCFDDPHFKAVFNLTVVYPKGLTCIANTLEVGSATDVGNGYQSSTFKPTNRMSSYLLAFAIGDLVSKTTTTADNIQIRAYSWRSAGNFLDEAVSTAKTCVEVMTTFTGISLPLEKLDHLAVPHFAAGGMENWGLIIYAAEYVHYDANQDTTMTRYAGIDVRCHEIAHQWFGDYVTADWWSNIMLHESFAAYFEDYTLLQGWPDQAKFLSPHYVASSVEQGFQADTWNSHPVITEEGSFDGIVYAKGSALLRMLSFVLTPDVFQKGLQNYLKTYAYGNADHYQLFEAMNAAIPPSANLLDWCNNPLNITRFMEPWLTQPHYPVLNVRFDRLNSRYIIEQQPFVPRSMLEGDYNYAWPVPFTAKQASADAVQFYWSNRYYTCPHNFDSKDDVSSGVTIPVTNDDPLIINFDSYTFARVNYDDPTFDKIVHRLNTGALNISPETIVRMINDEMAIFARNEATGQPASYLRALRLVAVTLNNTDNAAVFATAQKLIDEMVRLGIDMSERALYEDYFKMILTAIYSKTSWDDSGADWNNNVLRERLLFYSVYFDIGDARQQALAKYTEIYSNCSNAANWVTCNTLSNDIRAAVYCGANINDNGTIFTQMNGVINKIRNVASTSIQEVDSLTQGMACTQTNIKQFVILQLLSRYANPRNLGYLVRNPAASDVIYDYMRTNINNVIISSNGFENALATMIYNWYTPRRIEMMQNLLVQIGSSLPTDLYKSYFSALATVKARSDSFTAQYLEITRHLYDAYYPLGFTPWTRRLPQDAKPLTYELQVRPYIPNKSYMYPSARNFTFDANIVITLQTIYDLTEIWMNSHRHVLESYSVLNLDTNTPLTVKEIRRDFQNAIVVLAMNDTIRANSKLQVTFTYSGFIFDTTPNEGLLSNFDYLIADGRKSWIFATDFEGGPSTRSLAVCFDEPAYKARWTVSIIYPGEFTALSNTLEDSIINLGDGTIQTTFKQTNIMSSYLLALTIGHYSCLKAVSNVDHAIVRIWTWTGMEQYGQYALDIAVATVDYMSSTLSTPMPLEKFDFLALPQYSGYSDGAMENWGLIIGGYRGVLFHPDYSLSENLASIQDTVTHELVHHWFGDLVTLDWWNHIFLNEGFATYWPPEVLEHMFPEQINTAKYMRFSIHKYGILVDGYSYAAQPVVADPSQLGPDYPLFSDAVYDKAGSIINTLRKAFGNDVAFYKGLTNYLKTWSFKNPADTDLWAALDSIAQQYNIPGPNGRLNVTQMMLPYTRQWSGPRIRVISSGGNSYSIAQNPLVPSSSIPDTPPFNHEWIVPYRYQINGSNLSPVQYLTTVSGSISINAPANVPVIFNPQAQTHARVEYDDGSWAPIQATLMNNPNLIDETSRAQILDDAWYFVQKKSVSWERFLNLTLYLQGETSPLVWRSVIRDGEWLQMLWNNFKYTSTYANLKIYLKQISSGMDTPAFKKTGDWSQDTANYLIADLKCNLAQSSCLVKAKAAFDAFITNCQYSSEGTGKCNPTPPDFRVLQFCFGLKQSPGSFNTVLSLFQWWQQNAPANDYFFQDAESLLLALSCSQDPNAITDLITATLNGSIPVAFFQYLANYDVSGSALFNYLSVNAQDVMKSPYFGEFISDMVNNWSSDAQLSSIQNFSWPAPLSNSQQAFVNSAIQSVIDLRTWLSTEGTPISQWLGKFVSP